MSATKREARNESKSTQQEKHLYAAIEAARKALATVDQDEILGRYDVAVIVSRVCDSARYGDGAVAQLQGALKLDMATLYRYIAVAKAWDKPSIRKIASRKNTEDLPISWSHLELIADVEDGRVRKGLVTLVLNKSLTVRQLGEIISESKAVSGKRASTVVSTRAAVRHLDRTLDAVKQQAVTWEKKVLPSLMSSRETLSEKEISGLRSAWDRMNETKVVLDRVSEMLREVLTPIAASPTSRVVEAGPVAEAAAGA